MYEIKVQMANGKEHRAQSNAKQRCENTHMENTILDIFHPPKETKKGDGCCLNFHDQKLRGNNRNNCRWPCLDCSPWWGSYLKSIWYEFNWIGLCSTHPIPIKKGLFPAWPASWAKSCMPFIWRQVLWVEARAATRFARAASPREAHSLLRHSKYFLCDSNNELDLAAVNSPTSEKLYLTMVDGCCCCCVDEIEVPYWTASTAWSSFSRVALGPTRRTRPH